MPKFTILNPQTNTPLVIDTDTQPGIRTWGDFKTELLNRGVDVSGMRATLRSSRTQLELNDAVLPSNDDMLLLTASKMAAGI